MENVTENKTRYVVAGEQNHKAIVQEFLKHGSHKEILQWKINTSQPILCKIETRHATYYSIRRAS